MVKNKIIYIPIDRYLIKKLNFNLLNLGGTQFYILGALCQNPSQIKNMVLETLRPPQREWCKKHFAIYHISDKRKWIHL